MRADHVGAPVTPQQWDYIHDMGGALRESLNNVTAVFAPSCIGHSVLTKRDWMNIKIDDVSLADALRCWEQSDVRDRQVQRRQSNRNPSPQKMRRKHNGGRRKKQQQQLDDNQGGNGPEEVPKPKLTKEERQRRRQERQLQRRLNRLNNKNNNNGREGGRNHTRHQQRLDETHSTKVPRLERSPNSTGKNSNSSGSSKKQPNQNERHRLRNQNKKRLNHKNRNRKNMNNRKNQQQQNANPFGLDLAEPKKCSLRLLERCSWPQCNHSCPTLTNPLTGEEMKFLELLASFGLDMDAVATALGVDMQTLNNMDHAELVNLLTQQVT